MPSLMPLFSRADATGEDQKWRWLGYPRSTHILQSHCHCLEFALKLEIFKGDEIGRLQGEDFLKLPSCIEML